MQKVILKCSIHQKNAWILKAFVLNSNLSIINQQMIKVVVLITLIFFGEVSGISIQHDLYQDNLVPNGDFENPSIPSNRKQIRGTLLKDRILQKRNWYVKSGVLVVLYSGDYCPNMHSNQVLPAVQYKPGSRKIDIFNTIQGLVPGVSYTISLEYLVDGSKHPLTSGYIQYIGKTSTNTYTNRLDLRTGDNILHTVSGIFAPDSSSMTLELIANVTPSIPLCIDNVKIVRNP